MAAAIISPVASAAGGAVARTGLFAALSRLSKPAFDGLSKLMGTTLGWGSKTPGSVVGVYNKLRATMAANPKTAGIIAQILSTIGITLAVDELLNDDGEAEVVASNMAAVRFTDTQRAAMVEGIREYYALVDRAQDMHTGDGKSDSVGGEDAGEFKKDVNKVLGIIVAIKQDMATTGLSLAEVRAFRRLMQAEPEHLEAVSTHQRYLSNR